VNYYYFHPRILPPDPAGPSPAADCQRACSRIAHRADLTLKVMQHTGKTTPAEAYAAWHKQSATLACQDIIDVGIARLICAENNWDIPDDVVDPILENGKIVGRFNADAFLARVGARIAWEKLKAEALPLVTFHIGVWRKRHPGADPLRDAELMAALRKLYGEIPVGASKLEYLHDTAAALELPAGQLQLMFAYGSGQKASTDLMPATRGLQGENHE
jgi:hypothetical protein